MKKKFLSLCIVISLLTAFIPAVFATEYDMLLGDIDNDDAITSADARLILRAAVGLEALEDDMIYRADVDGAGGITSADARLTLRTAVSLEPLEKMYHTHQNIEVNQTGDCEKPTFNALKCEICGFQKMLSFTNAPGHDWTPYEVMNKYHSRECLRCGKVETEACKIIEIENSPATCEEDGLVVYDCICGKYREEKVLPGGHAFSEWVLKNGAYSRSCARCGEAETTLDWLSAKVNPLKNAEESIQYVTNICSTYVKTEAKDYDFGTILVDSTVKSLISDELNSEEIKYNGPTKNIPAADEVFPAKGKEYVFELTEDDVKSIVVSENQKVDALASFPSSPSADASSSEKVFIEAIAGYKARQIENAVKVSITLNQLKATRSGMGADSKNIYTYTCGKKTLPADSALPLERFYGLRLQDICREFPQSQSEEDMDFSMDIDCPSATADASADWYFDGETMEPIACVYEITIDIVQEITLNAMNIINGTIDMDSKMVYCYVYLFDNYYSEAE